MDPREPLWQKGVDHDGLLEGLPLRLRRVDNVDDPTVDNHCEICGEFESECLCLDGDAADDGRLFEEGNESDLHAALDDYLTRTPPHPFDGDEL